MDISKFLDKKKREISDKFNEGEASNRQTESSMDNFIANATGSEVFTESLKSEGCPAVLHNYMKIVENFVLMYEKTSENQIKGESQL